MTDLCTPLFLSGARWDLGDRGRGEDNDGQHSTRVSVAPPVGFFLPSDHHENGHTGLLQPGIPLGGCGSGAPRALGAPAALGLGQSSVSSLRPVRPALIPSILSPCLRPAPSSLLSPLVLDSLSPRSLSLSLSLSLWLSLFLIYSLLPSPSSHHLSCHFTSHSSDSTCRNQRHRPNPARSPRPSLNLGHPRVDLGHPRVQAAMSMATDKRRTSVRWSLLSPAGQKTDFQVHRPRPSPSPPSLHYPPLALVPSAATRS